MPEKKKGGKKKVGGAKKKPKAEWPADAARFALLDVRCSAWASMRFSEYVDVSEPLRRVRELIVVRHAVVPSRGLRLFLGDAADAAREFKPEDMVVSLAELGVAGGSPNECARTVLTYEHAPFASIIGLPRGLPPPRLDSDILHGPGPGVLRP